MTRLAILILLTGLAAILTAGCQEQPQPSDDVVAGEAKTPEATAATADDETDAAEPAETADVDNDAPAEASNDAKAEPKVLLKLILPDEDTIPFLTEKNFVMTWAVLGPFTFSTDDIADSDVPLVDHVFIDDEATLTARQPAPEGTTWQVKTFAGKAQPGQIDLNALYNGVDHAAAYAVAWLDAPTDVTNATLRVGSDDYIKVWLNGKLLLTCNELRASDWDQDVVTGVMLKKGLNHLVVKCIDATGGYDFYLRLTDKDERPMVIKRLRPQPTDRK